MAAFTRGVHEAVGFDRISVLLATSDGRSLELVSSFGEDEPAPPPMLPLSPAAGVFYQAYETRRTIAVLGDHLVVGFTSFLTTFFREQYQVSREITSFFEEESPSLVRLSGDFARTLVSNILEGY